MRGNFNSEDNSHIPENSLRENNLQTVSNKQKDSDQQICKIKMQNLGNEDNLIKIGDYIVIRKHNYLKLFKFNKVDSCISLGKVSVNLRGIEGCPYYSVFKMISSEKKNKEFKLMLAQDVIDLADEIEVKASGNDNRNIYDDGNSQKLTAAEIENLKGVDNKASEIVEKLISNSNTFFNKTEFSQQKYLKKKQTKYFEYIEIIKPNLRIVAEILYKLDSTKIQGIRIDTLSQITTACNIHSEGIYLLYDSGSNGLVAASLLHSIGRNTNGKLLHMHPGNMSQKQALLALNLPEEHFSRCLSVNIYSALRQYYQGCDTNTYKMSLNSNMNEYSLKRTLSEQDERIKIKVPKLSNLQNIQDTNADYDIKTKSVISNEDICAQNVQVNIESIQETLKNSEAERKQNIQDFQRKCDDNKVPEFAFKNIEGDKCDQKKSKMPKWHYDNVAASELLASKMDSLIIVCKEDPLNIFKELSVFVKPGRPFVVYYNVIEPLQQMYLYLKQNSNVGALHITNTWMRNYQVLPDRTHPEVTMNASSGFLLTGYILK